MSIVSSFLVSSQLFVEFDVFSNHNEIVHRPYRDNRCSTVNIITFIWLRTGSVVIDQQLHLVLKSLCKGQPRQLRQLYCKSGCPFLKNRRRSALGIPHCRLSKTLGGFPVLALEIFFPVREQVSKSVSFYPDLC